MDNIHRPDKKSFVSEVVNVRAFREEAEKMIRELPQHYFDKANTTAVLMDRLGYSENQAAEMLSDLSPSGLRCDADLAVKNRHSLPKLPVLDSLRSIPKEKIGNDDPCTSQLVDSMERRTDYEALNSYRRIANSGKILEKNRLKNEAVLTVVLAKPYDSNASMGEITRRHGIQIDRLLLVLSSQKLTELRDAIFCPNDCTPITKRVAEGEDQHMMAKNLFTGGLFYVNGVFYNDCREKKSTDLSIPILKWAQRRLRSVGPFSTAKMEDTTFEDLNIRLGQPYVYIHQGDCEHLLIFSDIHLGCKLDPQDVSWYPVDFTRRVKTIVHCDLCEDNYAKWIVHAKEHLPQPTLFFCQPCLSTFCLDENDKRMFDLTLLPLIDSNLL